MAVYARSDVMSIAIPATSGGCGGQHSRPVVDGAPVKVWKLDSCGPCESVIREEIKACTVSWTDKDRVAHEHNTHTWGDDPTRIPLTPDEERVSSVMEKQGKAAMADAFQGMAQALIKEQRKEAASSVEDAIAANALQQRDGEIARLQAQIDQLMAMNTNTMSTSSSTTANLAPVEIRKVHNAAPVSPRAPGECIVCGAPTRVKPRGPAPKRCAEHRAAA